MPASQDALANFLRTSLRSGTAADAPEVTPLYDLEPSTGLSMEEQQRRNVYWQELMAMQQQFEENQQQQLEENQQADLADEQVSSPQQLHEHPIFTSADIAQKEDEMMRMLGFMQELQQQQQQQQMNDLQPHTSESDEQRQKASYWQAQHQFLVQQLGRSEQQRADLSNLPAAVNENQGAGELAGGSQWQSQTAFTSRTWVPPTLNVTGPPPRKLQQVRLPLPARLGDRALSSTEHTDDLHRLKQELAEANGRIAQLVALQYATLPDCKEVLVPYQHPHIKTTTKDCYIEIPIERVVEKIIEVPIYKKTRTTHRPVERGAEWDHFHTKSTQH